MKKLLLLTKTLLVATLLLGGANSSSAQIWTSGAVAVDDGEYYLYNVGANCYLNRGGTYTTHAIVDGQGVAVKLDKKEGDGVFSIYTGVNSKYLGAGCYTDEAEANWTFEVVSVDGYNNVYKLKASDNKYLYWTGGGSGFWGNEVLSNAEITEGNENNFYWMLISKSTRQDFASASAVSPLEITYLVSNPDFEYQIQNEPWKNDDNMKPWTGDKGKITQGWTNTNFWRQDSEQIFANGIFFEKWDGNGLTTADKIYQNVTLQAGDYRLTCTGYARCTEFYLYAGNEETHITDAGTYTVDFTVSESSSVEIGTKIKDGGSGDWVAFDNVRLYCKGLNYVQLNKETIAAKKGDITSLINGDFQTDASGWTGGSRVDWVKDRGWRGDNNTIYYERSSEGPLSYTLKNMPAGTYKVVAAARGYNDVTGDGTHTPTYGTITPQIAGVNGTQLVCVGDTRNESSTTEINTNGVEMPYNSLGGFTTNANGHNWKWITATGTLAEDGDLVINFNCIGSYWMAIDDVHLYCTELDETSYTRTVGDGKGTINTSTSVVTADIIIENPNTILRSTGKVTTVAGDMNNNQYNSSRITKLVLYDGYNFTNSGEDYGLDNGAILYRNIPANTWCTLMVPFYPTNLDVKKVPSSFDGEGVLTFVDAPAKDMNDSPMLVKSTAGVTSITGLRNSTYGVNKGTGIYGSGVPMTGVYSAGNVPVSDSDNIYYVLGTDNNLHKVVGSEVTIAPFRAYFTLASGGSAARGVLRMNFGDVTGVANIEAASEIVVKDGKYIENGKLVIVKKGVKYNAAGQQVK